MSKALEKAKQEKEKYFEDGDPDLPQKEVFCEFCAVRFLTQNTSKNGILRILENPEQGGRRRIIMSDSHDLNTVVLNHFILPDAPLIDSFLNEKKPRASYMPVNYPYLEPGKEGKKEQIALQFVTKEILDQFVQNFNESLELNKKLLI